MLWSRVAAWRVLVVAASSIGNAAVGGETDFRRDVLPILSNHCFSCHGSDEAARKAGLRLDVREAATKPAASELRPIVPGNPDDSELVSRIHSDDPDYVMPPPAAKKPLSPEQKAALRKWIGEGAEYAQHWAFVPPRRPEVPAARPHEWPRNAIDAFILRKLVAEGLTPSPEAERSVWLRRVTLDLTGLPPSPEELDGFLADELPASHEKVVDRLLASPRHAERMAMLWLDAARYADTNGYNNDENRSMWPWRDWVIRAFAEGMPYDQFLVEQLAGDLLPDATLAQKVATGFNRNHVLTTEGGIIEEEYHVEYVADRVHTTATVLLAMSLQCARCHDHKYDPISQRDYYQFAAFFNNVPDRIVGYSQGKMADPLLKVPSPEQQAELARLDRRGREVAEVLKNRKENIDADLARWEASLTPEQIEKAGTPGLAAYFPLDESAGERIENAVDPANAATIRGKVSRGEGRIGRALEFDGKTHIDAAQAGAFESDRPFSLVAWVKPASKSPSTVLSKIDEDQAFRGYDLILEDAKVCSHIVHHWPDKGFKVVSKQALSLNEWHHLAVTYDGSRAAGGVQIFIDGKASEFDVTTNNRLDGSLQTDKPFHIGLRTSTAAFQGWIDDVQLYSLALTADDAAALAAGKRRPGLKSLLAVPRGERSGSQQALVRDYFLTQVDEPYRALLREQADLPRQVSDIEQAIPVTMVMQETEPRRQSFILRRGQYDQRGEAVPPGVPSALSAFPEGAPPNRLGLARWLTGPTHPLTARVAVNRWWELLFGTGLVETSEDFGIQGSLPSHAELLDWLATELVRTGWDQRRMLKLIVLSATYRQSSRITPALLERDPRNRLLARGPRHRLPAETVRDLALAVSGLLCERPGGPSVKPYQPEGLWEDVSVERREKYVPESGAGLYRRSMYTFWKRTCPPPGMAMFDAPDRETCVIRRARTNTPLQALVLLNDPTYVEASRKLAEAVLDAARTDDARMAEACRRVLSRSPTADEVQLLLALRDAALKKFRENPDAGKSLLGVGHSRSKAGYEPAELAAWSAVMSILLNLDEAVTKG